MNYFFSEIIYMRSLYLMSSLLLGGAIFFKIYFKQKENEEEIKDYNSEKVELEMLMIQADLLEKKILNLQDSLMSKE